MGKSAHERSALQHRQYFRRNSSAYKNSPQRQDLERQVAGFGPVHSAKHLECVSAYAVASRERRFGNRMRGIARRNRGRKPLRLLLGTPAAQKPVNVDLSGTREHALPTDMAEFMLEKSQQLDLLFANRSKARVAAFGSNQMVALAFAGQQRRLAQSGSRRDHRDVAMHQARAVIDYHRICFGQMNDTERGRAEI